MRAAALLLKVPATLKSRDMGATGNGFAGAMPAMTNRTIRVMRIVAVAIGPMRIVARKLAG